MSDLVEKWGLEVAQRGFAQVPNHLLLLNQFLAEEKRLAPTELLVLIQLVGNWWRKDELPFPSVTTLAARVGASPRQVQRALKRLEADGFLQRKARRSGGLIASNVYDLKPLAGILEEAAKNYPNAFPRRIYGQSANQDGAPPPPANTVRQPRRKKPAGLTPTQQP